MYYKLYLDVTIPNAFCQDVSYVFVNTGQDSSCPLLRRQLFDHCDHFVAFGETDLTLLVEYHCPGFEGKLFHVKLRFFWFCCHWKFLPVCIFHRLRWIILIIPRLSRFQFYHKVKLLDWRLFDRELTSHGHHLSEYDVILYSRSHLWGQSELIWRHFRHSVTS